MASAEEVILDALGLSERAHSEDEWEKQMQSLSKISGKELAQTNVPLMVEQLDQIRQSWASIKLMQVRVEELDDREARLDGREAQLTKDVAQLERTRVEVQSDTEQLFLQQGFRQQKLFQDRAKELDARAKELDDHEARLNDREIHLAKLTNLSMRARLELHNDVEQFMYKRGWHMKDREEKVALREQNELALLDIAQQFHLSDNALAMLEREKNLLERESIMERREKQFEEKEINNSSSWVGKATPLSKEQTADVCTINKQLEVIDSLKRSFPVVKLIKILKKRHQAELKAANDATADMKKELQKSKDIIEVVREVVGVAATVSTQTPTVHMVTQAEDSDDSDSDDDDDDNDDDDDDDGFCEFSYDDVLPELLIHHNQIVSDDVEEKQDEEEKKE